MLSEEAPFLEDFKDQSWKDEGRERDLLLFTLSSNLIKNRNRFFDIHIAGRGGSRLVRRAATATTTGSDSIMPHPLVDIVHYVDGIVRYALKNVNLACKIQAINR